MATAASALLRRAPFALAAAVPAGLAGCNWLGSESGDGHKFRIDAVDVLPITHLKDQGFTSAGLSNQKSFGYAKFISDDDCVLGDVILKKTTDPVRARAYMRAGPRETLHFDPKDTRAAIVTCGGLCPGLNTVVKNLVEILGTRYGVEKVYGIRGGYRGFTAVGWDAPLELDAAAVGDVHREGGTVLGTSRGGFDAEKIVDWLKAKRVNQLYVVGGDGTHRGAYKLAELCWEKGVNIAVAGVPKTIDNDIPLVDRSFGFDTAVAEAKRFVDVAAVEARSFPRGLGVVRLMGRDAGFLAVHAALAAPGDVDACLVPEKAFALDGPDGLLAYVADRLERRGSAVLVVAEGVGARVVDGAGESVEVSGDVGPWLCDRFRDFFDGSSPLRAKASLKYVDPSYAVRAAPSNAADTIFCSRLAQHAVHGALAGYTAFAVGAVNTHLAEIPLSDFANRAAVCSVSGRLFGDLVRSTGQPSFVREYDAVCDDDLESPTGGCVVTWGGPTETGVVK
mmetsp:Transcript_4093/g.12020  ORF Transcript_4093/g.12020 Transcript_4093/m.12020 type:complete len:507 (+) Transcript_4093:42-1562(+)